jgi:hypothetical protein
VIYLSSPATSPATRSFNLELASILEKEGFAVYLPQRDGINVKKPPYSEMTREERSVVIFETNCDLIFACDVFLFAFDRRYQEGSEIFNLGLAYSHRMVTGCNRLIIGLQTSGALFLGVKLHPTLRNSLDTIVGGRDALVQALTDHKNGIKVKRDQTGQNWLA